MKVKNWLMDMQEYAYEMIELCDSTQVNPDCARRWFLIKYPNQERVFDDCKTEWSER